MIRERVLTISTVLAFMALSGAANADPKITDRGYPPNEVGTSSQLTYRQSAPDWYRARAMQPGAPPAQISRGQYGCRYSYQGGPGVGPKSSAWC
jgi:hypothetical protein